MRAARRLLSARLAIVLGALAFALSVADQTFEPTRVSVWLAPRASR